MKIELTFIFKEAVKFFVVLPLKQRLSGHCFSLTFAFWYQNKQKKDKAKEGMKEKDRKSYIVKER